MRTRKAILPDAPRVYELIAQYTGDGTLLPRSLPEICENIRDFTVVEERGKVIACAALHIYGIGLAEVRSVSVDKNEKGRSVGRRLIDALVDEARVHKIARTFLFTRVPEFFGRLGFVVVPHYVLPEKVHRDCLTCTRRHACDEIAMLYGGAEMHDAVSLVQQTQLRVLNG